MKLYYIGPNVNPAAMAEEVVDARMRAAIAPIADLILDYFRADSFAAIVGLTGLNPPYPAAAPGESIFGRYRVTHFQTEAELRTALIGMGDPFSGLGRYFMVRSLISCRAVTYGYDGQAFLCLRTEDAPPVAPDPELIWVNEWTELLTTTDYLDGAAAALD
ncbi:MAG TPA: hypothetical protein VHZ78_11370 [Rhizomicrobium sp.]|nr:hypothetical protein [Rhizomicrobium sp.]